MKKIENVQKNTTMTKKKMTKRKENVKKNTKKKKVEYDGELENEE